MKKFISFSGGVESTTMCLIYGNTAKAIFADTKWEHAKLYERLNKVEKQIQAIHPNFEIIRIISDKHPEGLKEYIKEYKYYPSGMARFCTRIFKIEPIDKFLSSQGECELMIGLNAEEGDKRTGNYGLQENVSYSYPLFRNGLTRAACIELLKKVDLNPVFPPYMRRGGCVGCFFKSKKEYIAMCHLNPEEFSEVKEIEIAIQDKRENFYGLRPGIPSMSVIEHICKQDIFSPAEMYDTYESIHTSCGVFCHR